MSSAKVRPSRSASMAFSAATNSAAAASAGAGLRLRRRHGGARRPARLGRPGAGATRAKARSGASVRVETMIVLSGRLPRLL